MLYLRCLTGFWIRLCICLKHVKGNPAGNYMFKVNNKNTRTRFEICSKLTKKTPELVFCSGVFMVNFEHISHLILVSLLLTLSRLMPDEKWVLLTLFSWVFKGCFNKHSCNFDNVSKIGYSRSSENRSILKWRLYIVIIFAHDFTNKILSRESNYIVVAVMWPN